MTEQQELSDHELKKLLPFYVNMTLDQDERASVASYLARSEDERKEVAYLTQLRQSIKDQPQVTSPGELGLKRLQRDIKRNTVPAAHISVEPATDPAVLRGEQASDLAHRAQESGHSKGVAVWWRNLAVAACLALAVLGGLSLSSPYLGNNDMQLSSGGNAAALQVTFKPQATEEAIRTFLLEKGLTIKAGPSALGVYHLDLGSGSSEIALSVILEQLRQRADVIETAESE